MAKEILIYDYTEADEWGYESYYCIGYGKLSAQSIAQQINDAKGDDLLIRINSIGGSVFDGFAIYNSLKAATGRKEVRIEGLAASIASIIAMAGDEITICQAAMMMVHKPTIDPFWCGTMDANDLQREADALIQVESVLKDIYASKTGLSNTRLQNMIDATTWLTPDVALSLGFVDNIERTVTERPVMAENAFNHVFNNTQWKAYANSTFKIKNMSNPNAALIEATNKNTSMLEKFMNWFKDKDAKNASLTLANGNPIYFNDADTFVAGTSVYKNEDQSEAVADGDDELQDGTKFSVKDGKIETVTEPVVEADPENKGEDKDAQIAELKDLLNKANSTIEASNTLLEKLKNTKSNYQVKEKTEFTKATNTEVADSGSDAVERYKNRKNNK